MIWQNSNPYITSQAPAANSVTSRVTTPILILQAPTVPPAFSYLYLPTSSYCSGFAVSFFLSGMLFLWPNLSYNSGLCSVLISALPRNRLLILSKAVLPLSFPKAHLSHYSDSFQSSCHYLNFLYLLFWSPPPHLLPQNIRFTISGVFCVPFHSSPGPRIIPDTM